jgi:hypothetical protein
MVELVATRVCVEKWMRKKSARHLYIVRSQLKAA